MNQLISVARIAVLLGCSGTAQCSAPITTFDSEITNLLKTQACQVQPTRWLGEAAIRLKTEPRRPWPGVTLEAVDTAEDSSWDLSRFQSICVDVRNLGRIACRVSMRIDSKVTVPEANDDRFRVTGQQELAAGEETTIRVTLPRITPDWLRGRWVGMRRNPDGIGGDTSFDPSQVVRFVLFVQQSEATHQIEFSRLRGEGSFTSDIWSVPSRSAFPMIDPLGQYRHRDWPGKTHSVADLRVRQAAEHLDLMKHPGPVQWNRYGGFAEGPQLKATGRFRVQKQGGRWWLVDPEGRLFWSQGIDCVHTRNATTPISQRESLFEKLPDRDSPLAIFYGDADWAPHGFYQGKGRYRTFNFTGANLYRKYGDDYRQTFADLVHRRLRSWGLNTFGNWSDPDIYSLQRTAYVVTASSGRQAIEGSHGYWGKFPDPFDPQFIRDTRAKLASMKNRIDSSWCIGVFVDNELAWGEAGSLAKATVASPPQQPAKRALLIQLKTRYTTIQSLNEAWDTEHASWEDLLDDRTVPTTKRAENDLQEFYRRIANQYFQVCRDSVKAVSPHSLYLGCRFAWTNPEAIRAAAKFCDVVGFNRYAYSVANDELPEGVDRPMVIGEFHFGALDRGLFHPGLKAVDDQTARAQAYHDYLAGALKHPNIVGAHWFQFGDQAATGRGDGENYQIGFVDVCDNPYPEMVEASRKLASEMYQLRLSQ